LRGFGPGKATSAGRQSLVEVNVDAQPASPGGSVTCRILADSAVKAEDTSRRSARPSGPHRVRVTGADR
jgi:hypothetical protein